MRSIIQQKLTLFTAVLIIASVAIVATFVGAGDDHKEHRVAAENAAKSFMTVLSRRSSTRKNAP